MPGLLISWRRWLSQYVHLLYALVQTQVGSCRVSYWLGLAVGTEALCFVVVVYKKELLPRLRDWKVFGDDQISHWCKTEVSEEEEEEDNLDGMLSFDGPEVIFRCTALVKMMMNWNCLMNVGRLFEVGELGQGCLYLPMNETRQIVGLQLVPG